MGEVEDYKYWDEYVEKFNNLSDLLTESGINVKLLHELIESYDKLS